MIEYNQTTNKYKTAFDEFKKAKDILLITHERPDVDALSSLGAMIELAEQMDKKYTAFCYNEPTQNYTWLAHVEKITSDKNKIINQFVKFDLIMVLDCGSLDRTKLSEVISQRKPNQFVIEFDHHPKIHDYTDLEIRITEAVSTSEILYYFFKTNKIKINKNLANFILYGILDDTDNFLHPSTREKTIDIASEMLRQGAQFPKIVKNKWQNKSLSAMKLWGKALNNLQINRKYNLAFSVLPLDVTDKDGHNEEDFDGISNFLSSLHDVNAIMLLREEKNPETGSVQIKGSLRSSHPTADISKLAETLGGGGHPKAAGFTIDGSIKKTHHGWEIK